MAQAFDPLWSPIIGHYRAGQLDGPRIAAHIAALRTDLRQFLIAGTTGDGWQLTQDQIDQWLAVCATPAWSHTTLLIAAFGADTQAVIARAKHIEARIAETPLAGRYAGLTITAQIDPDATQAAIAAHVRAVVDATESPLAVYQLPQVTGCTIAPETFAALVADHPQIKMFKDTSGEDAVAKAGLPRGAVRYVRGAEGGYLEALQGGYDGWLLSSGNVFARQLRDVASLFAVGDIAAARALSDRIGNAVTALFALAADVGTNPFADANRAADHIRAHGAAAENRPSERHDGSLLPVAFIAAARDVLEKHGLAVAGNGYLGMTVV